MYIKDRKFENASANAKINTVILQSQRWKIICKIRLEVILIFICY
jgi:hypothetical protein